MKIVLEIPDEMCEPERLRANGVLAQQNTTELGQVVSQALVALTCANCEGLKTLGKMNLPCPACHGNGWHAGKRPFPRTRTSALAVKDREIRAKYKELMEEKYQRETATLGLPITPEEGAERAEAIAEKMAKIRTEPDWQDAEGNRYLVGDDCEGVPKVWKQRPDAKPEAIESIGDEDFDFVPMPMDDPEDHDPHEQELRDWLTDAAVRHDWTRIAPETVAEKMGKLRAEPDWQDGEGNRYAVRESLPDGRCTGIFNIVRIASDGQVSELCGVDGIGELDHSWTEDEARLVLDTHAQHKGWTPITPEGYGAVYGNGDQDPRVESKEELVEEALDAAQTVSMTPEGLAETGQRLSEVAQPGMRVREPHGQKRDGVVAPFSRPEHDDGIPVRFEGNQRLTWFTRKEFDRLAAIPTVSASETLPPPDSPATQPNASESSPVAAEVVSGGEDDVDEPDLSWIDKVPEPDPPSDPPSSAPVPELEGDENEPDYDPFEDINKHPGPAAVPVVKPWNETISEGERFSHKLNGTVYTVTNVTADGKAVNYRNAEGLMGTMGRGPLGQFYVPLEAAEPVTA